MANRRHAHTYAGPSLTGGEDRPEPACAGRWFIYDVLTDHTNGDLFRSAVKEARTICGTCPLMTTCLRENLDEQWARSILGVKLPTVLRASCGTSTGAYTHSKNGEEACDPCKAIWRQIYHERKARQGAAA